MSILRFLRPSWLNTPASPATPPAIDEQQWRVVEARLPFLDFLPAVDRPRLRSLALEFLQDKEFHGANGLELTPDILLEIALQACLPILNLGLSAYRGWVGIIVYPGEILIPREEQDEDGVVHVYEDNVLGEAWDGGPVLLSWSPPELSTPCANVVLHEFAHKLDMANGEADGFPSLPADMSVKRWSQVFSHAYAAFCAMVEAGEDTAIDPYAAEHPAEFFAVLSEVFFESPCLLKQHFPDVYEQLSGFYRQDPATGAAAWLATHAPNAATGWPC